MLVSHGVLKKGLKNNLNLLFLYRLGGLKNSTTMKQEPFVRNEESIWSTVEKNVKKQ
jgi:hypothetical protein